MEKKENSCLDNNVKSVFVHQSAEELSKAFTELWAQLINEKEGSGRNQVILQTKASGL